MKSILLIGDSCTDFYHIGSVNRISSEAPVPILDVNKNVKMGGMATNVFRNLEALNHSVVFKTNGEIIEKHRCIDEKSMQHILRMDVETEIKPLTETDFTHLLYDGIVISDYDKGYITEEMLLHIINETTCPVFIDTKKNGIMKLLWQATLDRSNVWIKINEHEYDVIDFGHERTNVPLKLREQLIVTQGANGARWNGKQFPVEPIQLHDATGAGDVFLSAFAHARLLDVPVDTAIRFANECARLSVQYPGVHTLQEHEIEYAANKLQVPFLLPKQEVTQPLN